MKSNSFVKSESFMKRRNSLSSTLMTNNLNPNHSVVHLQQPTVLQSLVWGMVEGSRSLADSLGDWTLAIDGLSAKSFLNSFPRWRPTLLQPVFDVSPATHPARLYLDRHEDAERYWHCVLLLASHSQQSSAVLFPPASYENTCKHFQTYKNLPAGTDGKVVYFRPLQEALQAPEKSRSVVCEWRGVEPHSGDSFCLKGCQEILCHSTHRSNVAPLPATPLNTLLR